MEALFLGFVLVAAPPALYVWAAVHPETARPAPTAAWAAAALPFVAAEILRRRAAARPDEARPARLGRAASRARWAALALTFLAAVFVQNMMWAVRLNHCGMTELWTARGRVEAFKAANGRFPATLEELGPLPRLRIWTVAGNEEEHVHPATSRVSLLRADAIPPDDGAWGYDPGTGRVFLSCTGMEPKLRRAALYQL